MESNFVKKALSVALTAALLAQPAVVGSSALSFKRPSSSSSAVVSYSTSNAVIKDGTAVIPSGADAETVKRLLGEALVSNASGVDLQGLEWEYYCTGRSGLLKNDAWGSVFGFTSSKKVGFVTNKYTHPALSDSSDGTYKLRLKGSSSEVTLTKAAKLSSGISLASGATAKLVYNEDASVNYDAVRQNIFDALVVDSTPALTLNDVRISYYASAKSGDLGSLGKEWVDIAGDKVNLLEYPAIGVGTQKIKVEYAGSDTYYASSAEAEINIDIGKNTSVIAIKDAPSLKLIYNDDLSVDYSAVEKSVFERVVDLESSEPAGLTADDITVEYYASPATGAVKDLGKNWVSLSGGKVNGLVYPGIGEGEQKLRITYAGDRENTGASVEVTVNVEGRIQSSVTLNEAPYEVGMKFNKDQSYNYEATKKAIFDAVVASTDPEGLTADDVTVKYNAGTDKLKNWQPLDTSDWTSTFTKFGPGEWTVQISWGGNTLYKPFSVEVTVTTVDNRIQSNIVCLEGAAFVYNMDASVMKQAILDTLVDWENSELPAKETLTADDFTMAYYASNVVNDEIDGGVMQWAPIEGGTVNYLTYPQMGAGEQQIRISFKGNEDYRPSSVADGRLSVTKAPVTVKVKSTSIYANDPLPENFVTTDPADKFDIYTIFGGLNSNMELTVNLLLPAKFTNSAVLKILDPIVEKLYGKSFTQMTKDGMTVGELKEFFNTSELLDVLAKLRIDTGTLGQILEGINKLPSVADNVRVTFSVPAKAGLYTVIAVTDNKNYETGVGVGALLIRMRLKGVNLTWNQEMPENNKLTVEEAAAFDFKATLSYDGDVTVSQSNVKYIYTGFTSKWKRYSSTTTPPAEPGRYSVTVVTVGGNYQAMPVERSFQIIK